MRPDQIMFVVIGLLFLAFGGLSIWGLRRNAGTTAARRKISVQPTTPLAKLDNRPGVVVGHLFSSEPIVGLNGEPLVYLDISLSTLRQVTLRNPDEHGPRTTKLHRAIARRRWGPSPLLVDSSGAAELSIYDESRATPRSPQSMLGGGDRLGEPLPHLFLTAAAALNTTWTCPWSRLSTEEKQRFAGLLSLRDLEPEGEEPQIEVTRIPVGHPVFFYGARRGGRRGPGPGAAFQQAGLTTFLDQVARLEGAKGKERAALETTMGEAPNDPRGKTTRASGAGMSGMAAASGKNAKREPLGVALARTLFTADKAGPSATAAEPGLPIVGALGPPGPTEPSILEFNEEAQVRRELGARRADHTVSFVVLTMVLWAFAGASFWAAID